MQEAERKTIEAIGELRCKYPYAAALLAYVAVERAMKLHLMMRKDTRGLTDKDIVKKTLGDVERCLPIPGAEDMAKRRNEVVHSNLYITEGAQKDYCDRKMDNLALMKQAIKDLRATLDEICDKTIDEVSLALIPNEPMDPEKAAKGKS